MRAHIAALTVVAVGLLTSATATAAAEPTSPATPKNPSRTTPQKPNDGGGNTDPKVPLFLTTTLDGKSEVETPGDPDGGATGAIRVLGNRVTFAFAWKGIGAPTAGHVHLGDRGVNGDVAVPLFTTAMPATVTAAAGAVTVDDPKTADALRANSSGFYLNLHNEEFPKGALRGQLSKATNDVDVLRLLEGGGEQAQLSGYQEVPEAGGPAVGDPTARSVAFLRPQGDRVGFGLAWLGALPTAAHIHKGDIGANGPIAVDLVKTPIPMSVFAVSGTSDAVPADTVEEIKKSPEKFYANLHTEQFPGGAIRGQMADVAAR
ncbi:CHRD domain-containing protein [Lentzea tibetensis]|nr:CHRD domain-containing protein [Lentzea tibetensis]